MRLSYTVIKTWRPQNNEVTTLTFLGLVTHCYRKKQT